MARSATQSSTRDRNRGDNGQSGGFAWSIRSGSRRASKVTSDEANHPSTADDAYNQQNNSKIESPSMPKMDRHARMKQAMAEAQSEALVEGNKDAPTQVTADGSHSPRSHIAADQAQAKAQAAIAHAQAVAARGDIDTARELASKASRMPGAQSGDRLGEGSLTFDLLGNGGDVVLADGVPNSANYAPGGKSALGSAGPTHDSPHPLRENSLPASLPAHSRAISEAQSRHSQSLVVPSDGSPVHQRSKTDHLMHPSQSTSALSTSPHPRRLSDASSVGGESSGRYSPNKSRKKAGAGGIASALAASGAGMAGMGMTDPKALAEAHARAVAAAAAQRKTNGSGGVHVDKDFVGSSQGGVFRDPRSGVVTERNELGHEVSKYHPRSMSRAHSQSSMPMSRQGSAQSIASDDSSASGLAAAASFPAMQAGALLTPAQGAPTIALDSSNVEPGAGPGAATSTESTGWPQSDVGPQITGFAVASSKRNSEFHSLFPQVPEDDYLIEDYGAAMVREILLQGRLYVSENHVCFYANILGWVTNIVVPFTDIVSIEKRMTALIIPNGIQIATLHVKHTFSSLLSRDTTFDLMANIWKLSHPDVPSSAVAAGPALSAPEDSDEESDRESKAGDDRSSKPSRRSKLRSRLLKASSNEAAKGNGTVVEKSKSNEGKATSGADAAAAKPKVKAKHPATSCPCEQKKEHYSTTALDTTYPTTPEKVYNLLFHSETFMPSFWKDNQKLMDLQVGPWKGDGDLKKREFSYIKPLAGGFGPKQTKCVITDEKQHVDFDKYITVLTTTRTPDVPSGGSFSVKTRTCFTWNGNGNVTKVFVTCATDWTARSMLRSVIDKASIDGQKGYYKDLDVEVRKYINEHSAEFKEEGDEDDVDPAAEASADTGENAPSAPQATGANESSSSSAAVSEKGTGDDDTLVSRFMAAGSTVVSTVGDIVGSADLSPSMLVLLSVVALLIVSNIWALSSSGAGRGQQRDPVDVHRLRAQTSARHAEMYTPSHSSSPEAIAYAVRDVLRDYLEPRAQAGHFHGSAASPHSDPRVEAQELKKTLDDIEVRLQRLKAVWRKLEAGQDRQEEGRSGQAG
ncbi:unnamed protein product [Jaminaea pallidilutea]